MLFFETQCRLECWTVGLVIERLWFISCCPKCCDVLWLGK